MKPLGEAGRRNGRSIPSFLIRNINVVRFNPSCVAAPFGPPILQPVASSVWSISARSESRSVLGTEGSGSPVVSVGGEGAIGTTDLGSGFGSTPSWDKNYGTLDQVLQLTYVARPRVRREGRHGFRRNVLDLPSHAAAENLGKMLH